MQCHPTIYITVFLSLSQQVPACLYSMAPKSFLPLPVTPTSTMSHSLCICIIGWLKYHLNHPTDESISNLVSSLNSPWCFRPLYNGPPPVSQPVFVPSILSVWMFSLFHRKLWETHVISLTFRNLFLINGHDSICTVKLSLVTVICMELLFLWVYKTWHQ